MVELDPADAERVAARAAELAELGLVLEPFGGGAVLVRETPALLGDTDVVGLVREIPEQRKPRKLQLGSARQPSAQDNSPKQVERAGQRQAA